MSFYFEHGFGFQPALKHRKYKYTYSPRVYDTYLPIHFLSLLILYDK